MAIQDKIAELAAINTKLRKEIGDLLEPAVQEMFVKYPDIAMVRFTGHTPSFNDGDPCYYSVSPSFILVSDLKDEDGEDIDPDDLDWNYSASGNDGAKEFMNFFECFPTEVLEEKYGDGVQITFAPNLPIVEDEYYDG